MKIINEITPTSDLTAIQVGDKISNGLGTFGEVLEITFDDASEYWGFLFSLHGGGFIEVKKFKNGCSL